MMRVVLGFNCWGLRMALLPTPEGPNFALVPGLIFSLLLASLHQSQSHQLLTFCSSGPAGNTIYQQQ